MFQMKKDTFLRRKGESFIDKPMILLIVVISISILILGFVSYITLPSFKTGSDLTLGYFIGFLFVFFILSIFPAIRDILDELNSLRIISDKIQSLHVTDFFQENQRLNNYAALDADHPIYRIRHELILAVRESDYEAYAEILSSLNQRAMEIFGDAKDRILTNGILMGLTFVWQESIFEAAKNNVQQFYKSLWDTIGGLYSYASKKKAPLLHFQEIEHFVYEHIQFLGRNNMGDVLTTGVRMLSDAFDNNLTGNRPPQEEISDVYDLFGHNSNVPHNVDSSLQWDYIERFIGSIYDIQQIAITNQDRELYRTCQFYTNSILNDLSNERYGNLGSYQTAAISLNILRSAQYYSD